MAGGKETPRQKMIGMMYLVLTALLALNVSKEILEAFVVMNTGLVKTDKNFEANNNLLYSSLKAQLDLEPARAKIPYENSQKVKKWADELHKYVADIKSELIQAEDQVAKEVADTIDLARVNSKDKYDNCTRIMCGETGTGGKASELKSKIDGFKKNLLGVLNPDVAKNTNLGLDTSDPPRKGVEKETWETNKFYHLPLAAQVSVLSQIQTEVRNAEGTVLNELFKSIGAKTIKVDKLAAQMIPSSSVVTIGDEFTAKIFVAAFNSSMTPDVTVNGNKISETDETGSVIYKARPGSEGPQKIRAAVKFINAEGNEETSEVEYEYMAIKPAAVVSPTSMNVFYIGVDNPVSISVPGSDPTKIEASLTGAPGKLTKVSNGNYMVTVSGGTKCTIPVSVKSAAGKASSMGAPEFRIKRIPDPTPMLLGKKSGEALSIGELKSAGYLSAVLENFDFKANFTIMSFEFGANIGGFYKTAQVSGNRFDSSVDALLNQVKPGGKIFFSDIRAKGPDGTVRTLTAQFSVK
ncbi:MAG: gliding motility protein GldM [Bacteroidetes bacterium]|nr:gliding motility protein GldM [Bacteroidota bacterium]